ncbi:MAG TPA: ABC transporter ATP-binding protein [Treponemataceae bacterium]|mgnify:CR=1 FL=1|jgi:biotin transport system ATP-binding protein|nr:ABC transporter ATP-binding protein [Treponemataceae bacterium]
MDKIKEAKNKTLFVLQNISKTFYPKFQALTNITFSVNKGDFIVIAGANGSGKTVLMHIIAGLEEASEGELIFFKEQRVGLVFQEADSQILAETVAEDVAFGPKNAGLSKEAVKQKVHESLQWTSLLEKKDFSSRLLSGGEKRRLALAGILALDSDIFIFDEPFANLDWPSVRQVCELLEKLKKEGKTILVLTHELEKILAYANRFIILSQGRAVFDGSVEEGLSEQMLTKLENWGIRNPLQSYKKKEDLHW